MRRLLLSMVVPGFRKRPSRRAPCGGKSAPLNVDAIDRNGAKGDGAAGPAAGKVV